MTIALRERGVRGVVLDIEGTTTPIAFVTDVLFPYARQHLREYLGARTGSAELADVLEPLRREHADDTAAGNRPPALHDSPASAGIESVALYLEWLMDRDRKSPALKLLQGRIWERGYEDGTLRGDVFADVPLALERWHTAAIDIAVYSSGSVLAQQLLFSTTRAGNLLPLVRALFDTDVGPKRSASSYISIAERLGCPGPALLFISDVPAELGAAQSAGWQVLLAVRPGNAPQPESGYEIVRTFDEITV